MAHGPLSHEESDRKRPTLVRTGEKRPGASEPVAQCRLSKPNREVQLYPTGPTRQRPKIRSKIRSEIRSASGPCNTPGNEWIMRPESDSLVKYECLHSNSPSHTVVCPVNFKHAAPLQRVDVIESVSTAHAARFHQEEFRTGNRVPGAGCTLLRPEKREIGPCDAVAWWYLQNAGLGTNRDCKMSRMCSQLCQLMVTRADQRTVTQVLGRSDERFSKNELE